MKLHAGGENHVRPGRVVAKNFLTARYSGTIHMRPHLCRLYSHYLFTASQSFPRNLFYPPQRLHNSNTKHTPRQSIHTHIQSSPSQAGNVKAIHLEKPSSEVFYLPVHMVRKESSTTAKLHAVFDVSAKTTTGASLHDTLLVIPTVHPPLVDVLLRFR